MCTCIAGACKCDPVPLAAAQVDALLPNLAGISSWQQVQIGPHGTRLNHPAQQVQVGHLWQVDLSQVSGAVEPNAHASITPCGACTQMGGCMGDCPACAARVQA